MLVQKTTLVLHFTLSIYLEVSFCLIALILVSCVGVKFLCLSIYLYASLLVPL